MSALSRLRLDMASPRSDILTSQISPTSSGNIEAAQTDHPKKIGSMPRKHCDPALTSVDPLLWDLGCPKCGIEMEPIDIGLEGPPVQQLQLCPSCYLVTWSDQGGLHVQQGVPINNSLSPRRKPEWLVGEPEEC